jgi:hypothetical protein
MFKSRETTLRDHFPYDNFLDHLFLGCFCVVLLAEPGKTAARYRSVVVIFVIPSNLSLLNRFGGG